jgi:hypothetical protein
MHRPSNDGIREAGRFPDETKQGLSGFRFSDGKWSSVARSTLRVRKKPLALPFERSAKAREPRILAIASSRLPAALEGHTGPPLAPAQ